jgi:hypothetical protein
VFRVDEELRRGIKFEWWEEWLWLWLRGKQEEEGLCEREGMWEYYGRGN